MRLFCLHFAVTRPSWKWDTLFDAIDAKNYLQVSIEADTESACRGVPEFP